MGTYPDTPVTGAALYANRQGEHTGDPDENDLPSKPVRNTGSDKLFPDLSLVYGTYKGAVFIPLKSSVHGCQIKWCRHLHPLSDAAERTPDRKYLGSNDGFTIGVHLSSELSDETFVGNCQMSGLYPPTLWRVRLPY